MGYKLSAIRNKIEGTKFLKAEHVTAGSKDRVTFTIKAIKPRPEGLNLVMVFELKEPVFGREVFPVSKTNALMLAESWPHDDTDSLIGAEVTCRVITRPGENGKTYSTLHLCEISGFADGKKQKPVAIKELARSGKVSEEEISDDNVPF